MGSAALISALLPVFIQYTPIAVRDIANLVHGNPQQQGEADDAYVARLVAIQNADAASVIAQDQKIQEG